MNAFETITLAPIDRRLIDAGLIMDLSHVTDQHGQRIWPGRAATAPPPIRLDRPAHGEAGR